MLLLKGIIVVFLISVGNALSEVCNSCVEMKKNKCDALKALKYLEKTQAHQLIKNSICGSYQKKICCSKIKDWLRQNVPMIYSRINIENHPNINLLPDKCGTKNGDRIIGGNKTDLYEFPWMVILISLKTEDPQFICGGTLITSTAVLTAAHCIKKQNVDLIRVGDYNIHHNGLDCVGNGQSRKCQNDTYQQISVKEKIIHEKYDTTYGQVNDIGILHLVKAANLSLENIGIICLPVNNYLLNDKFYDENAVVVGWGTTEARKFSDVPRKAYIPIISSQNCRKYYQDNVHSEETAKLLENVFCAGKPGHDSCNRDSGGPLMLVKPQVSKIVEKYVQYGIVSIGKNSCESPNIGIYVDVRKYMTWILDNLKPKS